MSNLPTNMHRSPPPTSPREIKPIESVKDAFTDTETLCQRIENLVDRLCGGLPRKVTEKQDDPDGDLSYLIQRTRTISDCISDANQALDRLEKII